MIGKPTKRREDYQYKESERVESVRKGQKFVILTNSFFSGHCALIWL